VILVLYRWKRPAPERVETGALWDAVCGGIRYVRESTLVKSVLIARGHSAWQRSRCWRCCRSWRSRSGDRVWALAGMLRNGRVGRGNDFAALAAAPFGGWRGGGGDRGVRG